jgi:Ice-binding-like
MIKSSVFTGISLLALAGSALAAGPGPKPVNLRSAGDFVILTKSGITDVPTSAVTGDIGTSPITGAADLLTCTEVDGSVFSVNAAGPEPCRIKDPTRLTAAVLDMETAYRDAAGRKDPDFVEWGAGDIGGLTLGPGLYKWGTSVNIATDVTLSGSEDDVWIFQIAGNLKESDGIHIHLIGGAQTKNVFWQVAGLVEIGTTAHLQGIVLSKTLIAMKTGAWVDGRLFSQTAITLEKNKVTRP